MAQSKPNILILDIETAPALVYAWGLYDGFTPIERVVKPTRVICWAAKWVGHPEVYFNAEWKDPDYWLEEVHTMMSYADAIVTQNGDKFDLPRLNGAFLLAGLPPVAPAASIDVLKTIRKLGYVSSKLGFVGPLLKVGAKVKHEGFELWAKIEAGDEAARVLMEKYNKQDVRLLERVYRKVRPFIKNHPHLVGGHTCPNCGSRKLQRRGERKTRKFSIERLHCQSCGAWSDGTRTAIRSKRE